MYQHTREWLEVTLASVGDAVIATDLQARVVLINPVAERLTGWKQAEAQGRPIGDVFVIVNERTRAPAENPALRALAEGSIQGLANHTVLISRDGDEYGIDDSAAPIRDADGKIWGVVLVFRDVTEARKADRLRAARLAVAQILSKGMPIEQSAQRLVEALPLALEWDAASLWMLDPARSALERQAAWARKETGIEELLADEEPTLDGHGVGLVDRAWARRSAIWLGEGEVGFANVSATAPDGRAAHSAESLTETALLRPPASPAALRGGLALPITIEGRIEGILALWSRARKVADPELADTVSALAAQIGGFIHRRRVVAAIRQREAELDDFFENAVVGLHWVDPNGIILRANRAELEMLGYAEEEYVGRPIGEFYVDGEAIEAILAGLRRGEEVRDHEVRLRAKDGSIRHAVVDSNAYFEDGRFVHSRCFTRDITDRKNAETNLRFLHQASQTLAGLVDYRTTLERIAQLAVPAFADWCTVQMAGAKGIELVASAHRDPARAQLVREAFERYPPDVAADRGTALVMRTGKPQLARVITPEMLVTAARTESHLQLLRDLGLSSSMTVALTPKKGPRGAIRFVTAESGRRYSKTDLETAKDLARHASTAIDNALMYEESRDADRRKDEFLATLAHELRNPLAPIRSGIDLLTMDPGASDRTLELMRRQIEHVVRLADDLLDISRITHGKVELRREVVALHELVEAAVAAVQPASREKGHDLTVVLPDPPISLDADPVRVLQVLENLLSNAVKYTDPGGRIEIRAERDDGFALLRVRDDGVGIDAELMAQIFEPFTQATSSFDRAHGGLGIGLTLVRHFVEMHGGTVSASSEGRGHGSEFVVRLPLVQRSRDAPDETADEAADESDARRRGSTPGRRVLVVDDNTAAATMLAMLLGRLGAAQVEIAADGKAALAKAIELRPDLILLDIGLPGMDGFAVARALRARREHDGTVLVALTGYGQEQDRRRSREAGFDEHLVKPASIEDLQRVLAMSR